MREIKFRGQHHITKKWLYGWLIRLEGDFYIINKDTDQDIFKSMNDKGSTKIIKETIGQFIGIKDKKGKEIYEGGIAKAYITSNQGSEFVGIGKVIYHSGKCAFQLSLNGGDKSLSCNDEIIGNIYKNPELLKNEDDVNG